ncbi:MAG TPA: HAD hydrolase-like protein [Bacteroidota bacterium]|nr:HAD hydrolase-like protein [Bacteroidota bacterium]
MRLAIFDIDDTLTDTAFVDRECFAQTFFDRYSVRDFPNDGRHFSHYTDPAIFSQIYEERFNSPLAVSELQRLQNHYLAILRAMAKIWPQLFRQIPGASTSLAHLQQHSDWRIAIATGSWEEAAHTKLKTAGIEYRHLPLATANDGFTRETIVETAIDRAQTAYGINEFSGIVLVGDGLWDLKCAQTLNLGFVGIASGMKAALLKQQGALHLLPDLTNFDALLHSLANAAVQGKEMEKMLSKP